MSILQQHKTDIHYADGAWAEASILRFPADALHFTDIVTPNPRIRMNDAGRLRYFKALKRGDSQPVIVIWGCLEADRPVQQTFPGIDAITEASETLLSTNAYVTFLLRLVLERGWVVWRGGQWIVSDDAPQPWHAQAERVLAWLVAEKRIMIDVGPNRPLPDDIAFTTFQSQLDLIPAGRCGFARDVARETLPRAVFNSTYFLLEHDDFLSHHSALGDPFGLLVQDGTIHRPPLYHRGTLWQNAAGVWQIEQIGMTGVALHLPDGSTLAPHSDQHPQGFYVNPAHHAAMAVYTRFFGVETEGLVVGHTPQVPDRIEYTVIDRQITGWKKGGGLVIPQNGFILSFDADRFSAALHESILLNPVLSYSFAAQHHQGMQAALGCGPTMVANGKNTLHSSTLAEEQYWVNRDGIIGVVPTKYPDDVDQSRAARIGMGVMEDGTLIVVAISGTSKGLAIEGRDSAGATLVELADALLAEGAREAINLDGGGSVQVFVDGGLHNKPGDQRGEHGVIYERMIPTVGIVSQ